MGVRMIMIRLIDNLRNSLASKLILTVGIVLLITIATWAFFNIRHQKAKMIKNMVAGTDRLTTYDPPGHPLRHDAQLPGRNQPNHQQHRPSAGDQEHPHI
jgi:cell division protein FtsN